MVSCQPPLQENGGEVTGTTYCEVLIATGFLCWGQWAWLWLSETGYLVPATVPFNCSAFPRSGTPPQSLPVASLPFWNHANEDVTSSDSEAFVSLKIILRIASRELVFA